MSVFHSNPKEGNAKKFANYHTIVLISHASKIVLKILQVRLQQYVNQELPDVQVGFSKGRGTRDQTANIHWIIKKQEDSRKTSTSASLTMLKLLTVWITTDCVKFFKKWECQTALSCLQRNLYAGQEATVGTEHGITYWFQIKKGVHQGCIFSPCLFNLICRVHPEKAMAPHSSTLAWKIPWMEEPGRLQSMGSQRVGHD